MLEAFDPATPAKEEVAHRLNELHQEIQAEKMKQQLPELLKAGQQKLEEQKQKAAEASRKQQELQRKLDDVAEKQKQEFREQAKYERSKGGSGCFAGHCEVVVKGQGKTPMSAVKCGDLVRGDKGWCRVVAWLHRCPITPLNMRRISTTAGSAVVTANHLLLSKAVLGFPVKCAKPAGTVIDMCIWRQDIRYVPRYNFSTFAGRRLDPGLRSQDRR